MIGRWTQCYISSFTVIGLFVLKKMFEGFYYTILVMSDTPNKHVCPITMEAPQNLALIIQEKKIFEHGGQTTFGRKTEALVYKKLTREPSAQ